MVRFILCLLLFYAINASSVEITVDAASGRRPVSPCLYGRNNNLSDDPGKPLSKAQWQLYRDAGIRLFRDNGGNNSTKYNWRLKLTSHPDWYNNVYRHDWDYSAASLGQNMPGAAGMWAFQLIGKAAKTSQYNFNDWGYNQSQWWEGVHNNWAGEGDIDLYLMDWPADSTTGIVSHWIAELGIPALSMKYWNMDNEPEIWNGTHDDVMPDLIPAEEFMQRYFEAAKKARAAFPDIRLAGPVPANEWQWFNWDNDKIPSGSKSYTWLEYFIKRIGEEQQASGVRLLDVLDVHFYPGENKASDIVQLHRVWFDDLQLSWRERRQTGRFGRMGQRHHQRIPVRQMRRVAGQVSRPGARRHFRSFRNGDTGFGSECDSGLVRLDTRRFRRRGR